MSCVRTHMLCVYMKSNEGRGPGDEEKEFVFSPKVFPPKKTHEGCGPASQETRRTRTNSSCRSRNAPSWWACKRSMWHPLPRSTNPYASTTAPSTRPGAQCERLFGIGSRLIFLRWVSWRLHALLWLVSCAYAYHMYHTRVVISRAFFFLWSNHIINIKKNLFPAK
jgi:hypothetical protein